MTNQLQRRIHSLGRTAKALTIVYRLAQAICLIAAGLVTLGLLDYALYSFFRIDDSGVRLLFAVALLATTGAALFRLLVPALLRPWHDVEVAQLVERWFPRLKDQLSSAISFLHHSADDRTAGSVKLRHAVIRETEKIVDDLPLHRALRPGPTICAGFFALVVSVSTLTAFLVSHHARLAARRLVLPLSNSPWPKRNELRFLRAPRRLAAGDDFEVALIDAKNQLPSSIEFHYRDADHQTLQTRPMIPRGDKMVLRLENVTSSLEYRATGGDDTTMPWRVLEVIEPPRLEEMHVLLFPPSYTGSEPAKSGAHITALRGSSVEIKGRSSKPLERVELKFETSDQSLTLDGEIGADQRAFEFAASSARCWTIERSGTYWLEMTGKQGIVGGRKQRWQVNAVVDQPPVVALSSPGQNSVVTSRAIVPVQSTVQDNLAIHAVSLRYTRSDQSEMGEQSVDLFQGPQIATPVQTGQFGQTAQQKIDYQWDLSTLADVHPGQKIDVHLAAIDYQPESGQSTIRQITIVTMEQFKDRIGQRQSYILGRLADALQTERESHSQTKTLEVKLENSVSIDKQDIDLLQSAELSQREVERLLSDPQDGVQAQIENVLRDLHHNRIENSEVKQPLTRLRQQLEEIDSKRLPIARRELLAALKVARMHVHGPSDVDPATAQNVQHTVRELIDTAGREQVQIVNALEQLLDELSEWDNFRRLGREIRRIGQQQSQITAETDDTSRELIGRSIEDLTTAQRTRLRVLAQQQQELSRQYDSTRSRMDDMRRRLGQQDAAVAQTIADALDAARASAIEGQMRESGREIQRNRLGQAAQSQRRVAAGLQKMEDILANRREHQLDRVVDRLREAAEELDDTVEQVRSMRDSIDSTTPDQATTPSGQLSSRSRQLTQRIGRLARQFERLQAEQVAKSVQQAEQFVEDALQADQDGDKARARDRGLSAQQQLEVAQQRLKRAIQQAERALLERQIVRFYQQVEGLAAKQQELNQRTQQSQQLRVSQGLPATAQTASVRGLSLQQQAIAEETSSLAESSVLRDTFSMALNGAANQMRLAGEKLATGRTDVPTQQSQGLALARLQHIIEALKPNDSSEPPDGCDDANEPETEDPADAVILLAELKLLRSIQAEINQRTDELEATKRRSQGTLGLVQQQELDLLAHEQGRLADLVLALVESASAQPNQDRDDPRETPEADDTLDQLDNLLNLAPNLD